MGTLDDQIKATEFLRREAQRKLSALPQWATLADADRKRMVDEWVKHEAAKTRGGG